MSDTKHTPDILQTINADQAAALDTLCAYLSDKTCSQCGKPFSARACGPTHAAIAIAKAKGAE
ncbi:hypothetical protein LCGC14_0323120 [marine sediment metagenome]|uniref:C2H2-type domain-containing protein n=1 Tax=marine sediment metagenome TaxID=412755 RepID=A0A0F9WQS2_9ZZZZ